MALTLLPTAAMAEGPADPVAQIGNTKYETLAAAFDAAKDGDTITLLKSGNGNGVSVPANKFTNAGVTVNFNSYTYMVGGQLVGSAGTGTNAFQLLKDNKITFKNGSIVGATEGSKPADDTPNWHGAPAIVIQNYCDLTLDNMTVTGGDETVYTMSNNCGNVVIKDTTINAKNGDVAFDVCRYASYPSVNVTVKGNSTINGTVEVSGVIGEGQSRQLNIEGGSFAGDFRIADDVPANISITGGTFNTDVSAYVADGYTYNSETKTVEPLGETNAVAKVGDTYYKTLDEAVTAADNATVTLLKDVTANVTIPAGNTITLNLNGHTLVDSATAQDKNVAEDSRKHTITNNGTLTILDSVGTGVVDNVSHGRAALYNAGTIVEIKGGKFTRSVDNSTDATSAKGNSWYVVYNAENATINRISDGEFLAIGEFSSLFCNCGLINEISGGTFTQNGFIAFKNEGTVNKISGGTFSSEDESCIQNWGSIGEITGGTITAGSIGIWNFSSDKYNSVGKVGQISGGNISGSTAAIRLNDYDTTYLNKPSTINKASVAVSGGNISGNLQVNANTELSVSGGSFSQSVEREYLDQSLNAELKRASGETPYSYYTSMNDALAAAKPGDTVTDLNATTEPKVTLTLKYNDGATADITYNVASGTTITLPTPAHRSGYTFNGWYDGSKFYAAGASYKVSATATLNASWSYISSGSSSYDPTYSVSTPSKTENGSVTVSPKNASKGDTVTVTVKPDSGYVLETLTVTDKNGNELTLKDKGNGKYTFTMPAGKVEVKATFMEDNSMLNFFYDVPNGAYFYEAVKWAVENGITTGVGNDLFAPEQPCTRAQIVTFLWRAAGSPEPKGAASGMSDVVSGSYYEKAVAWAIENGITTGTTATTFSPDATCTRGQSVTFLHRALKGTAPTTVNGFTDVAADAFYADAVAWAVESGVTNGTTDSTFSPNNGCTRAQIVTFLYRAYQGK